MNRAMRRPIQAMWLLLGMIARPNAAIGGGSMGTDELLPLLRQQPEVYAAIQAGIELSDSAFAETRVGSHVEALGGARVGPYSVRGKVRGTGEPVEVVLCTHARFLDS